MNYLKSVIKQNQSFFLLYLVFLIFSLGLLVISSNQSVTLFANQHYFKLGDKLFFEVSEWANGGLFYFIVLIVFVFQKRIGLYMLYAGILGSVVAQFMKRVLFSGSERPFKYFENSAFHLHLVEGTVIKYFNSFPSGHTTTAFCLASFLSFFSKNKFVKAIFFIYAVLVAYSRMYLGQHFFIDVIAGSLVGTISASFILVIYERNNNDNLTK